ncbi:MAG TPA: hypothetical protein VLE97_11495 [Gaiellaceae bacterium]|nr:hypothetical protein [Gaiellaceae bacterium]
MIDLAPDHLLFIEPELPRSAEPVVDEYTRRMAGAMRSASPQAAYRGIHHCRCGEASTNCDYVVRIAQRISGSPWHGLLTNSLAVHYLAFHRDEVPPGELAKVLTLTAEPVDPAPPVMRVGEPRPRRLR